MNLVSMIQVVDNMQIRLQEKLSAGLRKLESVLASAGQADLLSCARVTLLKWALQLPKLALRLSHCHSCTQHSGWLLKLELHVSRAENSHRKSTIWTRTWTLPSNLEPLTLPPPRSTSFRPIAVRASTETSFSAYNSTY